MSAPDLAAAVHVDDPIARTIAVASKNVEEGGRPFACVIVRDGVLVAESGNLVAQTGDPTAHAEVVAIRVASQVLQSESFVGCSIYVIAHPCPMCLGALYYCDPDRVVFLTLREDYARFYRDDRRHFDMDTFYDEFGRSWQDRRLPMEFVPSDEALAVYQSWVNLNR